jgi:Amidase
MDMRAVMKRVFSEVDFVVVPTLPVQPPLKDAKMITVGGEQLEFTLALIRYTFIFDHTGNPVVSFPVLEAAPGLGASVQVVGDINRRRCRDLRRPLGSSSHRDTLVEPLFGALTEQLSLHEEYEAVAAEIRACRLPRRDRSIWSS